MRYAAYLKEGALLPGAPVIFKDRYDDLANGLTIGVYVEGLLVSSMRIHVLSTDNPDTPAMQVFADKLQPLIDNGMIIIDPTRFVNDVVHMRNISENSICYGANRGDGVFPLRRRLGSGHGAGRASVVLQARIRAADLVSSAALSDARQAHKPHGVRRLQKWGAHGGEVPVHGFDAGRAGQSVWHLDKLRSPLSRVTASEAKHTGA